MRQCLANYLEGSFGLGPGFKSPGVGPWRDAEMNEHVDAIGDGNGGVIGDAVGPARVGAATVVDCFGAVIEADDAAFLFDQKPRKRREAAEHVENRLSSSNERLHDFPEYVRTIAILRFEIIPGIC